MGGLAENLDRNSCYVLENYFLERVGFRGTIGYGFYDDPNGLIGSELILVMIWV